MSALRSPSRSARRRFAVTGLTLLTVVSLGSCAGQAGGGFQMPPVPVEVAEVSQEGIADRFRALGTIESEQTVQVVNEIASVVRALPFAEGQPVGRGQVLARLDDDEISAEAIRAEALRDQARTNHSRVKQLFDQRAASSQELDDASSALKVADANNALAKARLSKTRIVSPLNGVVGRRLVSVGAYLRTGDPITEVASIDPMRIVFSAPERYIGLLKRGAEVEIATSAYPGELFRGQISVVDPILDASSRTVQLVARVPNRTKRLRPGMSADVSAVLSERAQALTVPDEAVFAQGDSNYVYVVQADSTVQRRAIVVGTREAARAEVTSGLSAGERVVRAGYQKLFPGARVMPVPSSADSAPAEAAPAAGATKPAGGVKPAAAKAAKTGGTR